MNINQLLLVVSGVLVATILFVAAPRALMWLIRDNTSSIWRDAPRKKKR